MVMLESLPLIGTHVCALRGLIALAEAGSGVCACAHLAEPSALPHLRQSFEKGSYRYERDSWKRAERAR